MHTQKCSSFNANAKRREGVEVFVCFCIRQQHRKPPCRPKLTEMTSQLQNVRALSSRYYFLIIALLVQGLCAKVCGLAFRKQLPARIQKYFRQRPISKLLSFLFSLFLFFFLSFSDFHSPCDKSSCLTLNTNMHVLWPPKITEALQTCDK